MTADDVVEAMARGGGLIDAMAEAAYGAMGFVVPWDSLVPQVKAKWRRAQLDAIRALHERGGLVVGEMPGEKEASPSDYTATETQKSWDDGYDFALAAVRANAVKVKP